MSKNKLQEAMKKRTADAKVKTIKPADIYGVEEPKPVESEEAKPEKEVKIEKKKPTKTETKNDDLVPYATYIFKNQKKNVKLHAIEQGIKDQEIVRAALEEYFEKHHL